MANDLQGPGRFSVTYVAKGAWGPPTRCTRRITLVEGQDWEAAKDILWRKHHLDPLHPYRPAFELHRWVRMAG